MRNFFLRCAAFLLPALAHAQAECARERRWADENRPALVAAEAIDLESSGSRLR